MATHRLRTHPARPSADPVSGTLASRLGRAVGLLGLLLVVGGCQLSGAARYPLGEPADCGGGRCTQFIEFATASVGFANVVSAQVFHPDFRGPNGEHVLMTRSGGENLVVVLTLDGGATVSFYVGCGVGINPDICFIAEPPAGN